MSISAPGKVLMTGGYLVLDPLFKGLVVATTARFRCMVKDTDKFGVSVISKQFEDGLWEYDVVYDDAKGVILTCKGQDNRFVQYALITTLSLARLRQKCIKGLHVEILADNDFYSQRNELERRGLSLTAHNLVSLPINCPTHTTLKNVSKTGLGSSAAMITSLVGALCQHLKLADAATQSGQTYIHNLAQVCHSLGQGKIGSGFDVSSAVYGSHSYQRFAPSLLDGINNFTGTIASMDFAKTLETCILSQWDNQVTPFRLPKGLRIMLADIDAGSSSPVMASKVLAWRKSKPEEANPLWQALNESNGMVESHLRSLASLDDKPDFAQALKHLTINQWTSNDSSMPILQEFSSLRKQVETIRLKMREMSRLADVPIEPPEQTRLLDVCLQVPGVICGAIPGAGGFDAIFLLVVDDDDVVNQVYNCWQNWKEMNVGPLLARQSDEGITIE